MSCDSQQIEEKLVRAKAEYDKAGPVHRRDLAKHIARLLKAQSRAKKK